VKIVFTNDDSSGNKDRNLYVTEIAVNGETIDLAEADNDQEPNTGALYANGSFTLDLTPYEAQLTPSEADNDTLAGGLGADRLSGGVGKDIFLFVSVDEVIGDVITDFVSGDDIVNLDAIDADEDAVGGQDFTWRGDQGLSGAAGDLAFRFKRDMTLVSGDTDGDGVADFTLRLTGKLTLQATDFDL
jgi:hypothetical protein